MFIFWVGQIGVIMWLQFAVFRVVFKSQLSIINDRYLFQSNDVGQAILKPM